jgi:hypothetical protein
VELDVGRASIGDDDHYCHHHHHHHHHRHHHHEERVDQGDVVGEVRHECSMLKISNHRRHDLSLIGGRPGDVELDVGHASVGVAAHHHQQRQEERFY